MSQFDVFPNPIARAGRVYPFVAVLQSELAKTGSNWVVAPLAVQAHELRKPAGQLTRYRGEIFAAIDYLFSGV